jgi:uncharacterized protein DUF3558
MTLLARRVLLSTGGVVVAVAMGACDATVSGAPLPSSGASSVPPTTSSAVSRPNDIDLFHRNPCDAIPGTDYARFKIHGEGSLDKNPGPMPDSRQCRWQNDTGFFGVFYVAGEGVDAWGPGKRRSEIVPVDPAGGYPVYNLEPPILPGNCDLLIDVHDGQYIEVDISPVASSSTDPCAFARQVTESVVKNLAGE